MDSFGWGGNAPEQERIIRWQAPPPKFGVGATREIGHELRKAGIRSVLTDESCAEAARELESLQVDGYVGLGGGSSMDTAKMLRRHLIWRVCGSR
ncbi:iron-containing alcohol dehydrogenase [Streptomyces hawaiiensis]|uniref:iron-containing alcohol dehydrogenase n=1 Tax=Streptomyces hawaiiensis TaxID=67305 RepID=UPI003648D4FA